MEQPRSQCAHQDIAQNFMQRTECDQKMPAGQCCGKVKPETGDEHLVMLRWINKTLHVSFPCRIQNSSLNKITTQPF
jgi:hypothetical protein